MLRRMDAVQALADLTEISSQVVQVAILDADGTALATTRDDPVEADRFVETLRGLVAEADAQAQARGLARVSQLEASTLEGSVFVVRGGERMIAATTRPDPTVGLVFYDLKRCLESLEEPTAEPEGGAEGRQRRAGQRQSGRSAAPRGRVDRPA